MFGIRTIGCAAILMLAAPAQAQDNGSQTANAALEHVKAGRHDAALKLLDLAIDAYARQYASEKRVIYCAGSPAETVYYMGEAAAAKKSAVAIDPGWCKVLWTKGYTLVDRKEYAAALPFLEQAVQMAPSHSHYLAELGYAYQALHDWPKSYATYARAAASAELSEAEYHDEDLGRGWRGMGFSLIEMGKLDEAEALFKKAIALDPNDEKSKNELKYIAEQRAKRS
ncbi:MAG: tetratricopeptide repeat protein [Sphingomonadales bacterium]|nr:MAG: tetratricopeptide repeat protein [Sphingomonadales bacterium]